MNQYSSESGMDLEMILTSGTEIITVVIAVAGLIGVGSAFATYLYTLINGLR